MLVELSMPHPVDAVVQLERLTSLTLAVFVLTDYVAGVNYVRTACVIAVSKSKDIFEPLIHQVRARRAEVDVWCSGLRLL